MSRTVLVHGDQDRVLPQSADVLIEGDRISKIEAAIPAPAGCHIIDCTDKIISPGFVDTHHHVWQSPLKGFFGDTALFPYLAIVHAAGLELTAEDMYWANLAGSLEAVDAGTTTTLDHAHMNWSNEHSRSAIAGTLSSGIRSIFGYTPVARLSATKPNIEFSPEPLPDWVMETFEQLATSHPLNDPESRVQLGFGFDFYHLPKNVVLGVFEKVKSLGTRIITSHFIRNFVRDSESLPVLLKSYGLLQKGVVLSHAGGATSDDVKLLQDANCFVSATPNTELAMAVGPPVCFHPDLPGIDEVCSLGVDCHSATSGSMVNEMRTALQTARGLDSEAHIRKGQWPRQISYTTADVFKMGTIQGARALCMEQDIGSIEVGKKADLVVFDALSPAMACVAQRDPVMAIVLHSTIRDIDTVLVDGELRKQNGKLLPVTGTEWHDGTGFVDTSHIIHWREVAERILAVHKRLVSKMPEPLLLEIENHVRELFGHKHSSTKL
ncbi:related to cytosine deaminase and related metal-dependent hydrolases [Phialocephala subalpina]|uniref:Related to cytosine deaminase and related metal-dependent hydrolases n=1 Tax=Phialocephala subalpina TaxID=576137 RepID=A0A1L7XI81_9HELO|nr:related to cytosine deaminase and related metal-dependent hydrolases [Phialocephala subalpina]